MSIFTRWAACAVASLALGAGAAAADPIRIGIEAPWGLSYTPLSLAMDKLKEQGIETEPVLFAEPDAMALALAGGDIQIATSDTGTILAAIEGGLPVKAIAGLTIPAFVLVAKTEYGDCEKLNGHRVGVHSQRDIFGTAINAWVAAKCPGAEFERIVLPGSENRMAALTANQLEATPIHLISALQLMTTKPGEYVIVDGFGFPEGVVNSWYYATTPWLAENAAVAASLSDALQAVVDEAEADPSALIARSAELVPDIDVALLTQAIERQLAMGFWNPEAGITKEAFDATVAFFGDTIEFATPKVYEDSVFVAE